MTPVPISSTSFLNGTHSFSVCGYNADPPPACDVRSIWAIVQTYLVTISLCTWIAAHPNLGAPSSGRIRRFWDRAMIALESVLTPELIVAWAMQQWLVAGKSVKDINSTCGCCKRSTLTRCADHCASRSPMDDHPRVFPEHGRIRAPKARQGR